MDLSTDIRVREASVCFTDFELRTPFVLSKGTITHACQADVRVRVEDGRGQSAWGFGTIFLSEVWSWPSSIVTSLDRVRTMKALCEVLADGLPNAASDLAHPLEHGLHLAETFVPNMVHPAHHAMKIGEPMPHLAGAVCFSPFDAAMHDGFGRLHHISAYQALAPRFLPDTLDRWLGPAGKSRHLSEFIQTTPASSVAGWQLVGQHDALTEAEVTTPTPDDLPDSLEGWIAREGVYGLKLKTTGANPRDDAQHTADIYQVACETHRRLNTRSDVVLEVDANEGAPSAEVVIDYLEYLREISPEAYDALLFIEQPVSRDLDHHPHDMREVAKRKTVFIDEGLPSYKALARVESLGWNGMALKTCKGHSLMLLCIAWCGLRGWPYSIMDLTNPGRAAVHSAGLAAHTAPLFGIELNCRQFVPQANAILAELMPDLTRMTKGRFDLKGLSSLGLGYPDGMLPG